MSCLICLLRHGETLWNREKRIQGQSESPLSPTGEDQARSWGPPLLDWNFTRVYSSTLGRAVHTAELVNEVLNLPLSQDGRLCEQDWGHWVGRSVRDLRSGNPAMLEQEESKGWDFRPPGGESRRELLQRGLEAVRDLVCEHPGERVLLVSHNGMLRALALYLQGSDYLPGTPDPVKRGKLLCIAAKGGALDLLDPARDLEAPL